MALRSWEPTLLLALPLLDCTAWFSACALTHSAMAALMG